MACGNAISQHEWGGRLGRTADSGNEGLFDDVLAALQGSPAEERGAAAARPRAEEAAVDVYECPITRRGAATADLVERCAERAVTRGPAAVISSAASVLLQL